MYTVLQPGHTLDVGDVVRVGASGQLTLAEPAEATGEAIGVVSRVEGSRVWVAVTGDVAGGLAGLIPGKLYYLAAGGTLTRTAPTSGLRMLVLSALTPTSGVVLARLSASHLHEAADITGVPEGQVALGVTGDVLGSSTALTFEGGGENKLNVGPGDSGNGQITVRSPATGGLVSVIDLARGTSSGAARLRARLMLYGDESVGDAGSDLYLTMHADDGAQIGSPVLTVVRAAGGAATWTRPTVHSALLTAGANLAVTGTVVATDDMTADNAKMGTVSGGGTYAYWAHKDRFTATQYTLAGGPAGDTYLNGSSLAFLVDNGTKLSIAATSIAVAGSVTTITAPGAALSVASLAASGLTAGWVPFAATAGLLTGAATLTFDSVNQVLQIGNGTNFAIAILNGTAATTNKEVRFNSAGADGWRIRVSGTRSGADAGDDLFFAPYGDGGGTNAIALTIPRANGGTITTPRPFSTTSTLAATGSVTGGALVTAPSNGTRPLTITVAAARTDTTSYVQVNAGGVASTTDLNAGLLLFNTADWGLDLGRVSSQYATRLFCNTSGVVAFASTGAGPSAQSSFTHWVTVDGSTGRLTALAASAGITVAKTTGVTLTVSSTDAAAITCSGGLALGAAKSVTIGGTQVLGARRTGWTAQTAAASRADLGAAPTNAALASFCRALYDDMVAHGLVGA